MSFFKKDENVFKPGGILSGIKLTVENNSIKYKRLSDPEIIIPLFSLKSVYLIPRGYGKSDIVFTGNDTEIAKIKQIPSTWAEEIKTWSLEQINKNHHIENQININYNVSEGIKENKFTTKIKELSELVNTPEPMYLNFGIIFTLIIIAAFFPGGAIIAIPFLYLQNKRYENIKHTIITMENETRQTQYNTEALKRQAEALEQQLERKKEEELTRHKTIIENLKLEIKNLSDERTSKEKAIITLDKEILLKSVDISVFENKTSEQCKNELSLLKMQETELIKTDKALVVFSSGAKKIINEQKKQILRSFNSECEILISDITSKNIDVIRGKITKSFETLNKIFNVDGVEISKEFLALKLEEATLLYAYALKREQELDQQKAIKAQMVEEEKVRREIEREKQKIEKEEIQFKNEIDKLMKYMQKSDDPVQNQLYIDKIKELEEKIKILEKDKNDIANREANTRAGFVYVISNIGSFGEDVFKIGMTRRLEPMDRVKELSDASVPFEFDVHAMIFSDDAPTLENLLHQTFKDNQINKINPRKEFFKVSLADIEKTVKTNYNATVEFTLLAQAYEYRESMRASQQDNLAV